MVELPDFRSLWMHTAPAGGSLPAEAEIVGAGIAGLTTARLLAEAGRSVLVPEARAVAGGGVRAPDGQAVCPGLPASYTEPVNLPLPVAGVVRFAVLVVGGEHYRWATTSTCGPGTRGSRRGRPAISA